MVATITIKCPKCQETTVFYVTGAWDVETVRHNCMADRTAACNPEKRPFEIVFNPPRGVF